jgi:hypothetical protein
MCACSTKPLELRTEAPYLQAALCPTRPSISSDDSEEVSTALNDSLRDSVSTTCSTPASDDEEGHEDFLKEQICRYLINTDNSGQTLMWHGLSTKFQVRPHLLKIMEASQVEDLEYIYLPQNIWEKKGKPIGKVRNKGYAFIHFRTEAAASDFQKKVGYDTTKAVLQGISANLRTLVSAPQKRTTDAVIYLPNKMNEFERVPIHELRDLFGSMTKGTGL